MAHAIAGSRRPANAALAALLALSMTLNGCSFGGLFDRVDSTVQTASDNIDIAISQLQNTSASWQQTLTDLEATLAGQAKDLIDNDIKNLINGTVAHAGVEFRCDADFINHRIAEALGAIKAKLLGQNVPLLEPQFCSAIPEAVDMKLVPQDVRLVSFYGYNFNTPQNRNDFQLKLEDIGGAVRDVTTAISIPTAYAMTLALGPSGVVLNNNSARLQLYWRGKLVSTVSVIPVQPVVNICQSSVANIAAQQVGPLIPPRVSGDKDFSGHGPTIWASGSISHTATDVTLHLSFRAKETRSDWTQVSGSMNTVVYHAPAGQLIDKVASATSTSFGPVTETGQWHEKPFSLGDGSLLRRVEITGDTDGDDVGHTGLTRAIVSPMQIVLHQTGNCVSPSTLSQLIGTHYLSADVTRSVSARVIADRARLGTMLHMPLPH